MELDRTVLEFRTVSMEAVKKGAFFLSLTVLLFFTVKGFTDGLKLANWQETVYFLIYTALFIHLRKELERREFRDRKRVLKVSAAVEYLCVLVVLSVLGMLAQYGAVWGRPLILNDGFLLKLDSLFFGFNWFKFNSLVVSHPVLTEAVRLIYSLINPSTIFLIILLTAREKEDEVLRFMMFVVITLAAAVVIFHLYPVVGPVKIGSHTKSIIDPYYQPSLMAASLGNGASFVVGVQSLDGARVMQIGGVYVARGAICLPSYHAVLAVGYMYFSKFLSKAVHVLFVLVSILMCLAAIPAGNHFLIDILAGFALAVLGIYVLPRDVSFLKRVFS